MSAASFEDCWSKFKTKNGLDKVSRMSLTTEEFQRVLRVVYDEGHLAGRSEATESLRRMVGDDPLKAMFGR